MWHCFLSHVMMLLHKWIFGSNVNRWQSKPPSILLRPSWISFVEGKVLLSVGFECLLVTSVTGCRVCVCVCVCVCVVLKFVSGVSSPLLTPYAVLDHFAPPLGFPFMFICCSDLWATLGFFPKQAYTRMRQMIFGLFGAKWGFFFFCSHHPVLLQTPFVGASATVEPHKLKPLSKTRSRGRKHSYIFPRNCVFSL